MHDARDCDPGHAAGADPELDHVRWWHERKRHLFLPTFFTGIFLLEMESQHTVLWFPKNTVFGPDKAGAAIPLMGPERSFFPDLASIPRPPG